MLSYKEGICSNILYKDTEVSWIIVDIEGKKQKAVNYNKITGDVNIGDKIVVNTTAVDLSLGTGGYHFVLFNYDNKEKNLSDKGHIIKLRYTPMQIKTLCVEEQDSIYHEKIKAFNGLEKSIFVVGTLHSMIAPISAMIKWLNPKINITYIMTDGGALPIQFSRTVRTLKELKIINNTITVGHSFGGDYECVNIYTGLITAKEILNSDVTIISMGPGIVGTGTKYGFSGIEQGYIIDGINNMGGFSFAVPRISFSDYRKRHQGISHHTLTCLGNMTNTCTNIILPLLSKKKIDYFNAQLKKFDIDKKHNIIYEDGSDIIKALDYFGLDVNTMGRTFEEDKDYFIALGAVGKGVAKHIDCTHALQKKKE